MSFVFAIAIGAAGWTLAEYLLHRFDFHARARRSFMGRLHLQHHADPSFFSPWPYKFLLFGAVVPPLAILGGTALGGPGIVAALSFGATYLFYEIVHRRVHTAAPAGPYAAWARRHHLAHHYVNPTVNHGVLTSFWDWLFGTLVVAHPVRVPRRRAPAWLLADPAQYPEYRIVGHEPEGSPVDAPRALAGDRPGGAANPAME